MDKGEYRLQLVQRDSNEEIAFLFMAKSMSLTAVGISMFR